MGVVDLTEVAGQTRTGDGTRDSITRHFLVAVEPGDRPDVATNARGIPLLASQHPYVPNAVVKTISAIQGNTKKQMNKANGVLVLENADYERLKTATETPSPQTAYNTQMSRSLVPFMKAIRDAADEAPAEETAAAEETEPDASPEDE